MKTGFFLTLAFAVLVGSASAQKSERTRELKLEEVPALVQQALQRDFSNLAEKGKWKLIYNEDLSTKKLTTEFYEYSRKSDGEWVALFYKSDGTLDHTKGVKAPTPSSQP